VANQLEEQGATIDMDKARVAYFETPVISQRKAGSQKSAAG